MRLLSLTLRLAIIQTESFAKHSFWASNPNIIQNSYLKKSPVTLSYEKLLKYVHSVQSRTTPTLNSQYGSTSVLLRPSHLVTEKEELDAL